MCLQAQNIDDNNGVEDRVCRSHGICDYEGGVGTERRIHNASEVLEKTTEASRIQGQLQRLWRRDDRPEELVTTTEASTEEDETKVSMTRTEVLAEEAEESTRLCVRLRRQRR